MRTGNGGLGWNGGFARLLVGSTIPGTLHTGLMGRQFLDAYREWWARLGGWLAVYACGWVLLFLLVAYMPAWLNAFVVQEDAKRSEEHTSELQSRLHLVCRLLLEKKNKMCISR